MSTSFPKFGVMDQGWAAPEVSDADAAQAVIRCIRLADELGFDSAWVGEHHHRRPDSPFWGRIPASEIVLGYAAAQTSRIALGGGVRILSTTSAQRTAEEMCMLSVLTGGRVDFGIGLGSGQHGMKTRDEKAAEFRRLLDELLATLRNDPTLDAPELSPVPAIDITTRLWAAGRDEPTIRHLAETGVNLVVGQAEIGAVQANYIRQYRAAGGMGRTRGVRLVFVAETDEQALADSAAAADLYYSLIGKGAYAKEAAAKGLVAAEPRTREEMLEQISFIVGAPDTVARKLNAYLATTGVDQLDAMVHVPRVGAHNVERTLRLLQAEVRPQLSYRAAEMPTAAVA
jgi:alkanesulfonate monooxygenase SsuD/methylene tetrahydromethanopterin reductase-like flavin-dependent oxidoreductase (luciferase family)